MRWQGHGDETLVRAAIARGIRRDMTPFLRVGFRQVDELLSPGRTPYLFCAPSTWLEAPMTYESASADGAVAPPPPPPVMPTGADNALREYRAARV